MNEQQRPGRFPRQGEIWHPADDPEDAAFIADVRGNSVYWTAPADGTRDRFHDRGRATRIDDFLTYFIPPQEPPVSEQRMTEQDLNSGTRGEYSQWVIETRLDPCRLGIVVTRNPYPELARQDLDGLRAQHPGLTFHAVRETVTRTEEDW